MKINIKESIAFILLVVILLTLAMLPIIYERIQQENEIERREAMYVTLDDEPKTNKE